MSASPDLTGAVRAQEALYAMLVPSLPKLVRADQVAVSRAGDVFDATGRLSAANIGARLDALLQALVALIGEDRARLSPVSV